MVINLPERKERLESMRKQFKDFTVIEGIRHPMPHTGCGLAHIDAIRKGLKESDWCVVLEDDCTLLISLDEFKELIEEIAKEDFDVCVLNPNHDPSDKDLKEEKIQVFKKGNILQSSPTNRLISTHAYIAKRGILAKLEEYERALLTCSIFLPIDRLFFNDHWDPNEVTTFEKCILSRDKLELDTRDPPFVKWNTPNTFIYIEKEVVGVSPVFISDHSGFVYPDLGADQKVLYKFLNEQPTKKSERLFELNIQY